MIGWGAAESARAAELLHGGDGGGVGRTPPLPRRGGSGHRSGLSLWSIGAVILAGGGVVVGLPLAGVLAGGLAWIVGRIAAQRAFFRRAEEFERDYPALLVALASSVRTGLDPLLALVSARELFASGSVLRGELDRVAEEIERGVPEDRVIGAFGAESGHPDVQLFRSAFLLARREGSSLGECLHRLAKVTRQRQSFRRKIRSAVAMQKLSAVGIGACAVFIGFFQSVTNPAGLALALEHPIGRSALIGGLGLMLAGLVWMFRLVKARI